MDRQAILLGALSILPIIAGSESGCDQVYLGADNVRTWWIERTIRWAYTGQDHMTGSALAREIALAFDLRGHSAPHASILEAGQQLAMVAEGYEPCTYVFPWAVVLRSNQSAVSWFRQIAEQICVERSPLNWAQWQIALLCNEALGRLPDREAQIIRARTGLATGHVETLEQIGNRFGLTRERIRQLEKKAWAKLEQPASQRSMWTAFAHRFIQSKGSLVTDENSANLMDSFLNRSIGLETASIPELGLIATESAARFQSLRNVLQASKPRGYTADLSPSFMSANGLVFLSRADGERIRMAALRYSRENAAKTRPRMLREVLLAMGRAAHFSEIADTANKMFPENQATTHNWHAALGRPDSEALGIVWIGVRGTYGLQEHGYSRPETDLFDAAATAVEEIYDATRRPVSEETVIAEIARQRREVRRTSVVMALTFNDRLVSLGRGEYVPKASVEPQDTARLDTEYDVDAAFAAFSLQDDPSEYDK